MGYFLHYILLALALINVSFATGITPEELARNGGKDPNLYDFIVPGQIGLGGQHIIKSKIINPYSNDHVIFIPTPMKACLFPFSSTADFGQELCKEPLIKAIEEHFKKHPNSKIRIYAASQGTSTAKNTVAWFARQDKNKAEKDKITPRISAVFLESPMITGNSAIHHCVTNTFYFGPIPYGALLGKLPHSDLIITNLAKLIFPMYDPLGEQALVNLDDIPPHILIFIAHSTKDTILPWEGALGVGGRLKKRGNKNVYFFKSERNLHIDLLMNEKQSSENDKDIPLIEAETKKHIYFSNMIFKEHGLPYYPEIINTGNIPFHEIKEITQFDIDDSHYTKYVEQHEKVKQIQPYIKYSYLTLIPLAMLILAKNLRR